MESTKYVKSGHAYGSFKQGSLPCDERRWKHDSDGSRRRDFKILEFIPKQKRKQK